jgi:PHD/YefM family antitoxin component YafN of YafNO toxin-antitoxin module
MIRTIAASEIKRRGMGAIDEMLKEGPVYVIKNNRIQYVIMDRARYEEVLEDQEEAAVARVKASLEDVAAGRVRTMSVEEIMG